MGLQAGDPTVDAKGILTQAEFQAAYEEAIANVEGAVILGAKQLREKRARSDSI